MQIFLMVFDWKDENKVNDYINNGWRVTMMSAMGTSGSYTGYAGMVVLEKEGNDK